MAPSVSKIAHTLVAFIGLVTAAPQKHNGCEPHTKCVDGINSCGVRYGGCYNVCDEKASPVAPLCAPAHSPTSVQSPTCTITSIPITSTAVSLCVDYINSCGKWYGGCFLSTSPFPTFTDPGCPTTTTTIHPTTTTTPTAIPTLCVDYVNSCGIWYGGCFAATSPFPSFTDPGCPTTVKPTTITTPTSVPTICVDTVNSCGMTYGGCFASTSPYPTFADPGCPTLTTVTVVVPTGS